MTTTNAYKTACALGRETSCLHSLLQQLHDEQ